MFTVASPLHLLYIYSEICFIFFCSDGYEMSLATRCMSYVNYSNRSDNVPIQATGIPTSDVGIDKQFFRLPAAEAGNLIIDSMNWLSSLSFRWCPRNLNFVICMDWKLTNRSNWISDDFTGSDFSILVLSHLTWWWGKWRGGKRSISHRLSAGNSGHKFQPHESDLSCPILPIIRPSQTQWIGTKTSLRALIS